MIFYVRPFLISLILITPTLLTSSLSAQNNLAIVYAENGDVNYNNAFIKKGDTVSYESWEDFYASIKFKQSDGWLKLVLLPGGDEKRIYVQEISYPKSEHITAITKGINFPDKNFVKYSSFFQEGIKTFDNKDLLKKYFKGFPYYWNWAIDTIRIEIPGWESGNNGGYYFVFYYNDKTTRLKISDDNGNLIINGGLILSNLQNEPGFDFSKMKNVCIVYERKGKDNTIADAIHFMYIPLIINRMMKATNTSIEIIADFFTCYFEKSDIQNSESSFGKPKLRLQVLIQSLKENQSK